MVLLDDLGYTDLGAYGGEAETPNIDALTQESAQFTDFHTSPLCAPTRASLMTGQDRHRVGLGSMEGMTPPGVAETTPGYKGSLEGDFTGIAEVLGEEGYDTYQVGKWHLGADEGQTPADLGFDRNFTLYDAGASYFSDAHRLFGSEETGDTVVYERDGEVVDNNTLPKDFFTTRAFTDEMLDMVGNEESDKPFFGYLAYNAPHDPLHVEDKALIDHYLDIYLDNYNYEEARSERIQRMANLGLIDGNVDTRWPEQVPEWDSLSPEQQNDLAYRMAVYAAVLHETDEQVGRVIDRLKETGEYDNTLFVLASDNGASASTSPMAAALGDVEWHSEAFPLVGEAEMYGYEGSYPTISLPNAQVSSGPYFQAKNTLFDGGTRVPSVIKTPVSGSADTHRIVDTFAHITDLYPTFADYAGADLGSAENLLGDSAKPLLEGTSDTIGDDEFGWEHFGHRAYRSGDWKLIFVPEAMGGTGEYALYNLAEDPGETKDVIAEHPEIAEEISEKWDRYAEENGVAVVDFEAVNEISPGIAERWFSIDWAEDLGTPERAADE
ncbi:sulfatase-like hydrolase/transferase [Corynebacterium sp. A21]|uniref:sulfatase-like hydrolase/transferase n=1 Tax=Corynebacterium sp. A21 TaxID=3457318 RepID=UPI003FD5F4A3